MSILLMTLRRISLLVALVALATSCAVGPRYHRPETPPNPGYAPTSLPEASVPSPVHGGDVQRFIEGRDLPFEWWQLFQSPALNALVGGAFTASATVTAAQAALAPGPQA